MGFPRCAAPHLPSPRKAKPPRKAKVRRRRRWARCDADLHPTPYTLHPTPYTPHPTPYTLHPTPMGQVRRGPTPYTLHPAPYTRRRRWRHPRGRLRRRRPTSRRCAPSALTPNTVELIPTLGGLPPPRRARPRPGPRTLLPPLPSEDFFFFFTLVTGPRRPLSLKREEDSGEEGRHVVGALLPPSSSLVLSSLESSGSKVHEPQIRALLGTAAHFC